MTPRRGVGLVALCASTLLGCASERSAADLSAAAPATTSTVPSTIATTTSAAPSTTVHPSTTTTVASWVVGAEPLPLRPDGLGEIGPTPAPLVERALPTPDRLPPPPGDDYVSSISPLAPEVVDRMGRTWSPGCPVDLDDLRHLRVSFWGFDGEHHSGELVVHGDVAEDLAWVFGRLHAARFPLEEVRIITDADLDAPPTGDGNTTASFVCRSVRGGNTMSAHASGLAVDVNPFTNPYVRGDVIIPERASAYLDRGWLRPGMIVAGDVVTESFAAIGWSWGGEWSSPDYMHFSSTGH